MSALWFLAIPLIVVPVAAVILWLRHREPTSLQHGIESFRKEMEALSPEYDPHRRPTHGERE